LLRLPAAEHEVGLRVSDGIKEDYKAETVAIDGQSTSAIKSITADPSDLPEYPKKELKIPIKGVNYLIGSHFKGNWGKPVEEPEMEEWLDVIRQELGCNAIKLVGDYDDVMVSCAQKAIDKGFKEIILSPRYEKKSADTDFTIDEFVQKVTAFSTRAEELREQSNSIILCTGEELEIASRPPPPTMGARPKSRGGTGKPWLLT
jgi:hypothetical protein